MPACVDVVLRVCTRTQSSGDDNPDYEPSAHPYGRVMISRK